MDRTCGNCEWFDDERCHKNPPQMVGGIDENGRIDWHSDWPDVAPTDWCGQWRKSDEPDPIAD